jgi:hypothetical protein
LSVPTLHCSHSSSRTTPTILLWSRNAKQRPAQIDIDFLGAAIRRRDLHAAARVGNSHARLRFVELQCVDD